MVPAGRQEVLMTIEARIGEVTARIVKRSRPERQPYLERLRGAAEKRPNRNRLGCSNLAHAFAGCAAHDKAMLRAA
jgi:phosphogluconate dehydratase